MLYTTFPCIGLLFGYHNVPVDKGVLQPIDFIFSDRNNPFFLSYLSAILWFGSSCDFYYWCPQCARHRPQTEAGINQSKKSLHLRNPSAHYCSSSQENSLLEKKRRFAWAVRASYKTEVMLIDGICMLRNSRHL